MSSDVITTVIAGGSAFGGALVGVGSLAWWLASRFNNVYTHISEIKEKISDKLDAHESLDVERFNSLQLSIMRIELKEQKSGNPLHGI